MDGLTITTTHINQLLRFAREHTVAVNGLVIKDPEIVGTPLSKEDQHHNDDIRESLVLAIRQCRHAACEIEAELHKLEYGYDIS